MQSFEKALTAGVERLSAWADLLDEINVYPVADGDTGRNLVISLSPLRQTGKERSKTIEALLLAARGNSGNIAARFFSGFLTAAGADTIPQAAELGRKYAWDAVSRPKKGTMLTVFDALSKALEQVNDFGTHPDILLDSLENAVHSTTDLLPRLKEANVIDSGALGMFIFFEGFFGSLAGDHHEYRPILEIFRDKLAVSGSFMENPEAGYCVDMVLKADDAEGRIREMAGSDESAVVIEESGYIKIHIHTDNREEAKERFAAYDIVKWNDDNIREQVRDFKGADAGVVHIMTDAAGSVTRKDAKDLGITLLDSYVISGSTCVPETHLKPEDLYDFMRAGHKVSTSQASDFERHQRYEFVTGRHCDVLYLCVGSVYTGNYRTAVEWKNINNKDRLTVMDTGTASGRLGVLAIAVARYAKTASKAEAVISFAAGSISKCREFIFLDKLHYLAKGGRLSKTGAFFGDMLNVRPVITPLSTGATKIGIAKNRKDQVSFLYSRFDADLKPDSKALIMIEYTDNLPWAEELRDEINKRFPCADIMLQPLSLTTGVHTGPGTWAVAYLDTIKGI